MWKRILLAFLFLLAAAAVYIFWPIREDLSHLANSGEGYDARILRDTWGVPHVFGVTDADAAYGLAYAHAQDDFLTIQQTVLAARGRLATVYGPDAAPNDYMVQLLRIWDVVDANYETGLAADTRALLDGYAAGLNHHAGLHSDEALPGLFPVSGRDMAAAAIHKSPLFFGLDQTLTELFAETRQNTISTRAPQTFLPRDSWAALGQPMGSNTFSVGPGRTANGETFLAINSHQPWQGPLTWYEAHVHSEDGWDAAGALLPGVPTIAHGHNRYLGWAFTVNSPDVVDVYVLDINPDNPNQYRFDGEWLDLELREAPITVKLIGRLRWTVKEEVLWSVYGPVIRRDHGTYAVRYAGYGEIGLFEQLYRMNKATNFDEWQAAMRLGQIPVFNTGYADAEGNIYYLYNGLIPQRSEGYDWEQYLPGDTSETMWTEYLPFDQLPQVFNPPSGFVQNANSTPFQTTLGAGNPNPAAYSLTLGIETHLTNRALRALELFGSDESITAEEFYTYKYDMAYSADSDMAAYLQRLFDADLPDDPAVQEAITLLQSWDLQTTPDNTAAALAILTVQPLDASPAEVSDEELITHLQQAIETLQEHYGRLDVPWQEVNRLQRGGLNLGLGGGPDIMHAVYGDLNEDGQLIGHTGDSYVMLITWDSNGQVSSQSIHQYGSATLNPTSPHYADQSPLFVQRQLKPVWLDEADIRANLESEYRPGEEID
jgi:acyl-homoserine-lactone acylase